MYGKRKFSSNSAKGYGTPFKKAYKSTKVTKAAYVKGTSARAPEKKFVDTALVVTISNATPGILLNGLVEGSDNNQRIGRKIAMESINFKSMVAASTIDLGITSTYPEQSDAIRVAIVYDTQSNGVTPVATDIWTQNGPYGARNMDNIERFKVLMDEQVCLSLGGPNAIRTDRYQRLDLPVRYTGTAAAAANITTGGLWLYVLDINGISAGTAAQLTGYLRVLFTDD